MRAVPAVSRGRHMVAAAARMQQAAKTHSAAKSLLGIQQCSREIMIRGILTMRAFPTVSRGRHMVATAARMQQAAMVPSAAPGMPRSTSATAMKGDSSAPILDMALLTPRPRALTLVGNTWHA